MLATTRRAAFTGLGALATTRALPAFAQTNNVETRRNIEYGKHDGVSLTGDLYMPAAPGNYPCVIAVHGGGWQTGSRST